MTDCCGQDDCCISDAVEGEAMTLEARRSRPGSYDEHGRWSAPVRESLVFSGALQPLRPEEIQRLEDARHIGEAVKIYTTTELRTAKVGEEMIQPDEVIWKHEKFEVESVADWGDFYKVIAVRREK